MKNNTIVKIQRRNQRITKDIRKYFDMNKTIYNIPKLIGCNKAGLRGKLITLNAYFEKEEISQII